LQIVAVWPASLMVLVGDCNGTVGGSHVLH